MSGGGLDTALDLEGDPADPASSLRAGLTQLLQEHVYLAGIAVYAAVHTPDAFDAAAGTLDENSVALSETVGSVYGDEAEEAWRIIDPVMAAWAAGDVPMEEYAAGTAPPARVP